jgi:hypothetical protein
MIPARLMAAWVVCTLCDSDERVGGCREGPPAGGSVVDIGKFDCGEELVGVAGSYYIEKD